MTFTKKFRSTSGKPERVINDNLDVAMIGMDWTVLPSRFHKAAYAAGCESEEMVANKIAPGSKVAKGLKKAATPFTRGGKAKKRG